MIQLNDNTYAIELEKKAHDFSLIYDSINKYTYLKYKINKFYRIRLLKSIFGECKINCLVYIQGVESNNHVLQAFLNTPVVLAEVLGESHGIVELLMSKGCELKADNKYLVIKNKL